eukprot:695541-Pleurochrysis_carterae.AAC.1
MCAEIASQCERDRDPRASSTSLGPIVFQPLSMRVPSVSHLPTRHSSAPSSLNFLQPDHVSVKLTLFCRTLALTRYRLAITFFSKTSAFVLCTLVLLLTIRALAPCWPAMYPCTRASHVPLHPRQP